MAHQLRDIPAVHARPVYFPDHRCGNLAEFPRVPPGGIRRRFLAHESRVGGVLAVLPAVLPIGRRRHERLATVQARNPMYHPWPMRPITLATAVPDSEGLLAGG